MDTEALAELARMVAGLHAHIRALEQVIAGLRAEIAALPDPVRVAELEAELAAARERIAVLSP